jgi:hypothetical protein
MSYIFLFSSLTVRRARRYAGRSRFAHWNDASGASVGSPDYYSKMFYTRGARCWNGPERNVVVSFLSPSSFIFPFFLYTFLLAASWFADDLLVAWRMF